MVPHNAFMFAELTVSQNFSEAERRNQLKSKVLRFMQQNLDTLDGKIILYHDSDPVLYDEEGTWTVDEQTQLSKQMGPCKPKRRWIDPWEQLHC